MRHQFHPVSAQTDHETLGLQSEFERIADGTVAIDDENDVRFCGHTLDSAGPLEPVIDVKLRDCAARRRPTL